MDDLSSYFTRNQPFVEKGAGAPRVSAITYNTPLSPIAEMAFRSWLRDNKVPFNPDVPNQDYDMRGFWQGLQQKHPRATAGIDPNDNRLHYPDYWKTPNHETFSNESQWANSNAPGWTPDDKLVTPGGRVLFDDRKPRDPSSFGF